MTARPSIFHLGGEDMVRQRGQHLNGVPVNEAIKVEIPLDILADKIADRIGDRFQRPKRLFTRQEAAKYLGRSVRGLDGLVARGTVALVRGDSRPMFDVRDLDAWIVNNKE